MYRGSLSRASRLRVKGVGGGGGGGVSSPGEGEGGSCARLRFLERRYSAGLRLSSYVFGSGAG